MSEAIYYKVSYVVEGGTHAGAIINVDKEPEVGEEVEFDGRLFVITDVTELMPPMGDFGFYMQLAGTCVMSISLAGCC